MPSAVRWCSATLFHWYKARKGTCKQSYFVPALEMIAHPLHTFTHSHTHTLYCSRCTCRLTFILLSDILIRLDEVLLLGIWRQVGGLVRGHADTLTLFSSSSSSVSPLSADLLGGVFVCVFERSPCCPLAALSAVLWTPQKAHNFIPRPNTDPPPPPPPPPSRFHAPSHSLAMVL